MTTQILSEKLEKISASYENNDSYDIRNELQSFFDSIDVEYRTGNKTHILTELSKSGHALLRKMRNTTPVTCENTSSCNITETVENIVFCCDLLAGAWKKRIFFFYDTKLDGFVCNINDIIWALLNIISNAIIHSDGKYISITQCVYENRITFIAESDGTFSYERFFSALDKSNDMSGLICVNDIVSKHGGAVFMQCKDKRTKVAVSLDIKEIKKETAYKTPSVEELLYDRLSVIYTALCEL